MTTQYRHGDLLLEQVDTVPEDAEPRDDRILARGEVTGHKHQLSAGQVLQDPEDPRRRFVKVEQEAELTHEEHDTITVEPGVYEVIRQRTWQPTEQTSRRVLD